MRDLAVDEECRPEVNEVEERNQVRSAMDKGKVSFREGETKAKSHPNRPGIHLRNTT